MNLDLAPFGNAIDQLDKSLTYANSDVALADFGRLLFVTNTSPTASASADSGLVHTVRCTSGNKQDITQAYRLQHGHEKAVWADAGYRGAEKHPGADPAVIWHVAMRPGKRKMLKTAGGQHG